MTNNKSTTMKGMTLRLGEWNEEQIRGSVTFADEFVGFDGHFPGNPILPGFVQVQAALDLIALALGKKVELEEIVAAKFLRPIHPNEEVMVEIAMMEDRYACALSTAAEAASRFELVLQKS